MERGMESGMERERRLFALQAELCQTLADPTRLELLSLLGERSRRVTDLAEMTGQRQAKISQHLALMRQRGIVRAQRHGTEVEYALADARILEACAVTRAMLVDRLARQAELVGLGPRVEG